MNWDAVGAIGEIIGALAVVVSVAYLSLQIRAGSKAMSTNLRDAAFASLYQWNYQLTADPTFAAMFHRGLQSFESLSDEEKPRFMHAAYGFFKVFENIFIHYLENSIGAEAWISNREVLYTFAKTPGGEFYLAARRGAFDERFVRELESVKELKVRPTSEVIRSSSEC